MNQYRPSTYPGSMPVTPSTYPNYSEINPYFPPNYTRSLYGQPPIQNNAPNSSNPRTILVSGIEEARAARIDFDGSLLVCVNINNGEVYTKQMLQNGSVAFSKGTLVPETQISTPLEQTTQIDPFESINVRLSAIEAQISKLEGGKQNGRSKSTATNTDVSGKSESDSDPTANGR